MKSWYNKNDCEHLSAYHAYYSVPVAAMLWCKVPPNEVQEELNRITPHPHIRGIFTHPFIPCFEVRCRIVHDAIESRTLPASRENGKVTDEHIAPERRYVSREHLKAWIAKEHPADRPPFLFDEIERKTHAAINTDAFRALQADRDSLRAGLEKATARAADTIREMDAMRGERDSLRALVDKMTPTYGNAQAITGPGFSRLQEAIRAFDPNNPPRSKKAFMGTLENLGCDTREQEVFANIVAEHFEHNWRS